MNLAHGRSLSRLASAVGALFLAVPLATPAWAAPPATAGEPSVAAAVSAGPQLYFSDYSVGYNGVLDGQAAHAVTLASSAGTVEAFSLNPDVDYATDTQVPYIPVEATDETVRAAAYVAVNAPSLGTALEDPKLEAVAVQLAVWKLASGLDYSTVANAAAKARADELVAAAEPMAAPPVTYAASAAWTSATDLSVTVTVGEFPVPGVPVSLSSASGVTGDDGTVAFASAVGEAVATVSPTLPAGTILAADGGTLAVTSAAVAAPFAVELPLAPVGVAEQSPTPAPSAAGSDGQDTAQQAPDKGSLNNEKVDKLPWTGSSTSPWLPLALLAFAVIAAVAGRRLLRH